MRSAYWLVGSCTVCGGIFTILFAILLVFATKGTFDKFVEKTCKVDNCTLYVETCKRYCDPDDGPCGPDEYYNCTRANAIYSVTWKENVYTMTIKWGMDYCPEEVKCHLRKSKPDGSLGLGESPDRQLISKQTFFIVSLIFSATGLFVCFGAIGVVYYEYKDNRRNVIHHGKYSSDSSDV